MNVKGTDKMTATKSDISDWPKPTFFLAATLLALESTGLSPAAIDKLLLARWPYLERHDLAAAWRAVAEAQDLAADLLERRPTLHVIE